MNSISVDHLNQNTANGSSLAVDYKIGSIVVYKSFYCDKLHIVDLLYEDGLLGITGFYKRENWLKAFIDPSSIRFATKAEIKARRRE